MKFSRDKLFSCLLMYVIAFLMLVEWLRATELPNPALSSLRNFLFTYFTSETGQTQSVAVLTILNLALAGLIRHKEITRSESVWYSLKFSDYWKPLLVLVSCLVYVFASPRTSQPTNYESVLLGLDQSTSVIVLLVGLLVGSTASLLRNANVSWNSSFTYSVLMFLVIVLTITSFPLSQFSRDYAYHSHVRWTGCFVNPNTYGLLMGTGTVLSIGLIVFTFCFKVRTFSSSTIILIGLGTAGAMSFGLVSSYSRGAWLSTLCGISYLLSQMRTVEAGGSGAETQKSIGRKIPGWLFQPFTKVALPSIIKRNRRAVFVIAVSAVVVLLWHSRNTESLLARRMTSVANQNDFSWRNRLLAWQGSLQMLAERPLGVGWSHPEPVYDALYRSPKLDTGMAILLNDYFTLATSLGIPAFALFIAYVRSVWKAPITQSKEISLRHYAWLRATCRAGLIVMLLGFWFDGGLFKLSLAVPFWLLLELSQGNDSSAEKIAY